VYNKATAAVGDSFPDGDPVDRIFPWWKKQYPSLQYDMMEYINKAFKTHGHGAEKKGLYSYVRELWDSYAGDAVHDATVMLDKGNTPERSVFFNVKDGKVVKCDNPWK
jgi:hypothetical protein